MKPLLDYETPGERPGPPRIDAQAVVQSVIGAFVLLMCVPLVGILFEGSAPGAGGGLFCVDCFLVLLLLINIGFAIARPHRCVTRASSVLSWTAFAIYIVLSAILVVRG